MKKLLMVLIAVICFASNANAGTRYIVAASTQIVYEYYDENNNKVGEDVVPGPAWSTIICADTPNAAQKKGEDECSTACSISNKNEGKLLYQGQYRQCYSKKRIYGVSVTSMNQAC